MAMNAMTGKISMKDFEFFTKILFRNYSQKHVKIANLTNDNI